MTPAQDSRQDSLALLRAAQDRILEREGIPMVLALFDETGAATPLPTDRLRAAGGQLAAAMDAVRADLVPHSADTDLGCLISVLQAVSYADANPERPAWRR